MIETALSTDFNPYLSRAHVHDIDTSILLDMLSDFRLSFGRDPDHPQEGPAYKAWEELERRKAAFWEESKS